MNTIKLLLCLLAISAIGCSEIDTEIIQNNGAANRQSATVRALTPPNPALLGTWIWVQSAGGFIGTIETPASTGLNKKMIFKSNSTYQIYTNEVLTSQGTYSIAMYRCIHTLTQKPRIHFSDDMLIDQTIEGTPTLELELSDDWFDGFGSLYQKQ